MTPGWEWGKGPPAAGAPTAQVEAIGHMQSPGGWAEAGRGGQEHGPVWALVLRTEHWVEGDSHPSGRGQPGQDGVTRRVQTRTPSQATVAATPWKRQLRRGGFSVSQCGRPGPLGGTPQDTEPMALQWCRPHAQLLGPQTHLLYVTPEGSKHLSEDHRAKPFSLRSNARKWYRCHLYPILQTLPQMLFQPPRCPAGHRWPRIPRAYADTGHGSTSSSSLTPSCPVLALSPPALGHSPPGAQRRPVSLWKLRQPYTSASSIPLRGAQIVRGTKRCFLYERKEREEVKEPGRMTEKKELLPGCHPSE